MHWLLKHDPEAWALMNRTGERLAGLRTSKAEFPPPHRPRRSARVWLGSLLLAMGHRLLRASPGSAAPA
jgi:hypothetical protein